MALIFGRWPRIALADLCLTGHAVPCQARLPPTVSLGHSIRDDPDACPGFCDAVATVEGLNAVGVYIAPSIYIFFCYRYIENGNFAIHQ